MKLLLVEDDPMVARGLSMCLQQADFEVRWVESAELAIECASAEFFDAAVFDLGLPGLDGVGLIRTLRAKGFAWPILVLTARDALKDRVDGLDAGADDYMIKPFEAPELLARLRALLRRSQADNSSILNYLDLNMDLAHRVVRVTTQDQHGALELALSPREWLVLENLLRIAPKPISKDRLLDQLQAAGGDITPNALEVYVSRLRSKLENSEVTIAHVRGFGYRLIAMSAE